KKYDNLEASAYSSTNGCDVLRIQRSAHCHRINPQRQRPHLSLIRCERKHFENQLVITSLPVLVEFVMERLASFARVFPAVKLLAVHFEDEPAFVVIELIIHVTL